VFVTNHVLSGALVGMALSDTPLGAFAVGIGSHLVLDALPHWGCDTGGPGGAERFLRVARRDGIIGLATMAGLAIGSTRRARTAVIAGMLGAVLLDLDKPALHFFGRSPFPAAVDRFHGSIQNESPEGMGAEASWAAALALLNGLVIRHGSRHVAGDASCHRCHVELPSP
jgi:hypothetical protein